MEIRTSLDTCTFCVYTHISYTRCFTNSIRDCITVSIYDWVTNTIYIWLSHEHHNSTYEFHIHYRVTNSTRDGITISIFDWVMNSMYTIKSWTSQLYIWFPYTLSSHELHTWLHHSLYILMSYKLYIYNQIMNSTTLHMNSLYIIESRTPHVTASQSPYMTELRILYIQSSHELHNSTYKFYIHDRVTNSTCEFCIHDRVTISTCEFYKYVLESWSPHMTKSTKSRISPWPSHESFD